MTALADKDFRAAVIMTDIFKAVLLGGSNTRGGLTRWESTAVTSKRSRGGDLSSKARDTEPHRQ